jgi:cytochrome c-type biogenesis protein
MDWAMSAIQQLSQLHYSIAVITSFTAGLLTSFNPCMLGMAASTMTFHADKTKQAQRSIVLAFILSFAATLTLLGVVSSFFGDQILMWNERNGSFLFTALAVLFILLGCYIMGMRIQHLYRLLPFQIIAFYAKKSKPSAGGGQEPGPPLLKAFSLGTLFGLTPSPCTTPMIIAMLAYSAVTGNVMLGSVLLFVYGIGHGLPFLMMGLLTGTFQRKGWMVRFNRVFNKVIGIVLIGFGVYFFLYESSPMSM